MTSVRIHPVLAWVALATVALRTSIVSAYTFDPLNNIWKPSGANNARRSWSASSYAPHPSEMEAPAIVEEEVIRAQYSTWAGHYHNGVDKEHGESFRQKSLVQIEYNKRTGEVSLMDQDGIITKEDYQNLMRAVSTGNDKDVEAMMQNMGGTATATGLDVAEDAAFGTTHFVDGEDIDQSQVIDTASEEVKMAAHQQHQARDVERINAEAQAAPQHHHVNHQATPPQQQHVATAQSFNTYAIPQPPHEMQSQLQEQQYRQLQHVQQQQFHQQHAMMMAYQHPPPHQPGHPAQTLAVADLTTDVAPESGGWGFNDRRSTFMN